MPKKKKTGQIDHGTEDLDAILAELNASQTVLCTEEVWHLAPRNTLRAYVSRRNYDC